MNNKKQIYTLKYITYALLLIFLYVLQVTPGFLSIFGVKPMLIIPAVVTISMMENEFVGGLYGAFAGVLCDLGSMTAFGFNGIMLFVCCVLTGLLIIHFMKNSLLNAALLTMATSFIRACIDYFFSYGMWGYENAYTIFLYDVIPTVIYSTSAIFILYFLVAGLYKVFESKVKI